VQSMDWQSMNWQALLVNYEFLRLTQCYGGWKRFFNRKMPGI